MISVHKKAVFFFFLLASFLFFLANFFLHKELGVIAIGQLNQFVVSLEAEIVGELHDGYLLYAVGVLDNANDLHTGGVL